MPSQEDVLDAFDSLGGSFNQPMALRKALEKAGFDIDAAADAIIAALEAGVLVQEASGSIRRA